MTPWTAAYQAPPSMGFSRQEYWSGVPLPSPQKKAEATLKQALTQAPALRLPDPEKAFQLYVHEREGINSLGSVNSKVGI